MPDEELPFKIVRTNGRDEVLARSINLLLGRAAFETAKRLYPNDLIEYRKGCASAGSGGWRRLAAGGAVFDYGRAHCA